MALARLCIFLMVETTSVAPYMAVVLAAGYGKRMGDLGLYYPKALLPVGDAPVIGHQLRMLRRLDVRSAAVVVGHRAADVAQYLGDGSRLGVKLTYVEQVRQLGSAHAVGLLRNRLPEPFLLLLGDYFISADAPERLLARLDDGECAIVAKRENDSRLIAESCELITDGSSRIIELIEKPVLPKGNLKGCGFYALQPGVMDYITRTPRSALRDEYELTISLDLYVKAGHILHAEQMQLWDQNFTCPSDVLECNLEWLRRRGELYFVGEGAVVEDGARLENVIIGADARVSRGVALRDVVVFPGATVPPDEAIRGALVTPYGIFGTDVVTSVRPA
jgi:NDP-sugar pyrophosphorylase family protein